MDTQLNRPRLAALALARAIRHLFADPHRHTWLIHLPISSAEELKKHPPKKWHELAKKDPIPSVASLLKTVHDLSELSRCMRRCRRLAGQLLLQRGSSAKEYGAIFKTILQSEFIRFVDIDYQRAFEDEGEFIVPLEVGVKPPMAVAADQMADIALKPCFRRTPKQKQNGKRVGRPRTVTDELISEAIALHKEFGNWKVATKEMNRRHKTEWDVKTVSGWKRYRRHRDKASEKLPKAA